MKYSIFSLRYKSRLAVATLTTLAIITSQILSHLMVYHILHFDLYISIIALAFLLTGYFIKIQINKISIPKEDNKSYLITIDETDRYYTIFYKLTNREVSIFKLLAEGKTNKEIAVNLCIGLSTVKTHLNNLYQKIACKNRIEARKLWDEMLKKGVIR